MKLFIIEYLVLILHFFKVYKPLTINHNPSKDLFFRATIREPFFVSVHLAELLDISGGSAVFVSVHHNPKPESKPEKTGVVRRIMSRGN